MSETPHPTIRRLSPRRIAVVLFNLGGPDNQAAVEPFLFNLFNDPNIIGAPAPIRWLLAKFISRRRAGIAREIYQKIGGGSPILPNTQRQVDALQVALRDLGDVQVFPCMRYWHPMTDAVVKKVKAFAPSEIILLPLYPQFSTTTTASSYRVWQETAARQKLTAPTKLICCYPTEPGFIGALARITSEAVAEAKKLSGETPAIIFSAHGLPKKIVDQGDPYVAQVAATVRAVASWLDLPEDQWVIAFQSKVGPLEWVGPATDEAIVRAALDDKPIVVVPVAFVSEHSETLVELDIEYRHIAEIRGAPAYVRAPTVSAHPDFIVGLAHLVQQALAREDPVQDGMGQHYCADWPKCACQAAEAAAK